MFCLPVYLPAVQDELLASPLAYKSMHEEKTTRQPLATIRPPRRLAGHKRVGETRPALVIAQGALAPAPAPAKSKRRAVFSMENALTDGFKRL